MSGPLTVDLLKGTLEGDLVFRFQFYGVDVVQAWCQVIKHRLDNEIQTPRKPWRRMGLQGLWGQETSSCSFHLCCLARHFPVSQMISDTSLRQDHLNGILFLSLAAVTVNGLKTEGERWGGTVSRLRVGCQEEEIHTRGVQMNSSPILWMENSWQKHYTIIYLNMCSQGQPSGQPLRESLELTQRLWF